MSETIIQGEREREQEREQELTLDEKALITLGSSLFSTLGFADFYKRTKRPSLERVPQRTLGVDPGETTGFALFNKLDIAEIWQENTSSIEWGVDKYHKLIHDLSQEVGRDQLAVIVEDYRVYSWKAKDHSWAPLLTPRLIGVLECLCRQYNVRIRKQSAQQGKAFMTDDRLRQWGFYRLGLTHGRDAARHAARFLLFGEL
jgi:hypothetical protein